MKENSDKRILIVTDDALLGFGMSRMLEKYMPLVRLADNWGEALSDMACSLCPLCFLDLDMSGADGLEVVQKMREASPGTRIVAMTAFPIADEMKRKLEDCAYMLLNKPFDPIQLKLIAKQVLETATA